MEWNTIYSAAEIDAYYAKMAKLDPCMAKESRAFYASRTVNQLKALAHQAWNCNEREGYVIANSFAAIAR